MRTTTATDDVRPRILLLTAPSSYRAQAFLDAANALNVDVVQIMDLPDSLTKHYGAGNMLDFMNIDTSSSKISEMHSQRPLTAVLSVDDAATELAAIASERLGLPANDSAAARAARDKFIMRSKLQAGGVNCPWFELVPSDADHVHLAQRISYPCVVKPRTMSGSRGVIRANNPDELIVTLRRTLSIVGSSDSAVSGSLLIEAYIPGDEVAVEGLMTDGELQILAIFDKPDPLEGPFFEETIYVTPSRHPATVQQQLADEVKAAASAIGLKHGPIHAEARIHDDSAWILEVAGRSIGGL